MQELLFLAHRIPFPPNKGDKIRSFNLLKHLSATCRVHLGAFVDDPADWRYREQVSQYCAETCLLPLSPAVAKLRSVRAFFTGQPLSLPYYADRTMRTWVESLVKARSLAGVLVFSSAMAQYVERFQSVTRVIDFVDVDSDKWRQYADRKAWPANWVYAREGRRLLDYERRVATGFDHSLFVSAEEAALFRKLAPEAANKVVALENGVDMDFFDPNLDYPDPYAGNTETLVFTGAMDYWANVDAVTWFAREIFPVIRENRRQARFIVVGARPSPAVQALAKLPGVMVIGGVKDIRPYLAHARLVVAPLRVARGVQNKVLEAMAMAKSLIASKAAVEGIAIGDGLDLAVLGEAEDWARVALSTFDGQTLPVNSPSNRHFVVKRYSWARSLKQLDAYWLRDRD